MRAFDVIYRYVTPTYEGDQKFERIEAETPDEAAEIFFETREEYNPRYNDRGYDLDDVIEAGGYESMKIQNNDLLKCLGY